MKNILLKSALLFLLTFLLGGCYTVIWNPAENDFPTRANTQLDESYYPDEDYAYFYTSPWWFEITPPSYISGNNNSGNNSGIGSAIIRTFDSGRGTEVRDPWKLSTNPPTQSTVKTRDVEKNNTNNSMTTTTRSGNNSNNSSNKSRNDDGSRKTDNGRHR